MKISMKGLVRDIHKKKFINTAFNNSTKSKLNVKIKTTLLIKLPRHLKIDYNNTNTAKFWFNENRIELPIFKSTIGCYHIIFHELIHSTMQDLQRPKGVGNYFFIDDDTVKEELIAEIGSLLLQQHFKILNVRSYVKALIYLRNWSEDLIDNNNYWKYIYKEATKAKNLIIKQIT